MLEKKRFFTPAHLKKNISLSTGYYKQRTYYKKKKKRKIKYFRIELTTYIPIFLMLNAFKTAEFEFNLN